MNEFRLEGIYPIEDPHNLPIKTIDLGRTQIFMLGDIDLKHINDLADVQIEEERPLVHIKLSVWEDSGFANKYDRQLLLGGMTQAGEFQGKHLFVFDPYDVRLWEIDEKHLLEQTIEERVIFGKLRGFLE